MNESINHRLLDTPVENYIIAIYCTFTRLGKFHGNLQRIQEQKRLKHAKIKQEKKI